MAYQVKKYQRMKDPFSMQPLPKSFYHPSPTKDVDEREAIKSPVRKNHLASQCAIEEQFLRGSPTYKTSALPRVKTVNSYDRPATEQRKNAEEVISSGHFDETWPDSERPTINSVSQNISDMTSVTEQAASTTHPLTSITDIVTGLEKLKFQPRETAKDTQEKDGDDGDVSKGQNGSVLQRYIERFRNAAPVSREERMRESEKKKQEFWWLHSPAESTTNTTTEQEKQTKSRQLHSDTKAKPESQGRVKLTREALTAMDEETEKLQNKADLLLSRSELSLASSGPIVSTDGLGTSTSVSDYSSVADEQAPYRPAFARLQEQYPKPAARMEKRAIDQSQKSPQDDILARWRLRRRMEDASTEKRTPHYKKAPLHQKPHRHPEIDARLEEFKKKILSFRSEITEEDIQFERQKMSLLLEENEQDSNQESKAVQQQQMPSQYPDPAADPVLERLQQITGNRYPQHFPHSTHLMPASQQQVQSAQADNLNFNNARANSVTAASALGVPSSIILLNRNNTASSNQNIVDDGNERSDNVESEPQMDSFGSQVVCNASQNVFRLVDVSSDATRLHQSQINVSEGEKNSQIDGRGRGKSQVDLPELSQGQGIGDSKKKISERKSHLDKRGIEYDKISISKESDIRIAKTHEEGKEIDLNKQQSDCSRDSEDADIVKSDNKVYHQYLEAEKPISENTAEPVSGSTCERKKNKASKTRGELKEQQYSRSQKKVSKSFTDLKDNFEKQQNKHVTENCERLRRRRQNRSSKSKAAVNDDVSESDALTDITNGSDHLSEKSSEQSFKVPNQSHAIDKRVPQEQVPQMPVKVSAKKSKRSESETQVVPAKLSDPLRSSGMERHQVHAAIGQTITDHLFDGSTLLSSVDSWASMFPQSPAPSRSQPETCLSTPSPSPSQREGILPQLEPLQSTPKIEGYLDPSQEMTNGDNQSDGEFEDDPLLLLLRQQRNQYLQKLIMIEQKLQGFEKET